LKIVCTAPGQFSSKPWDGTTATTACAIHNLGVLYRDQGRYKEAGSLFKEAQPILERAFKNRLTLSEALEDQAALLRATNRGPEADVLSERAAKIRASADSLDLPSGG
jgi:tetratricopeptide (TPR) repeat protein